MEMASTMSLGQELYDKLKARYEMGLRKIKRKQQKRTVRVKVASRIKLQLYICEECGYQIGTSIERPQRCPCGNTIIAPVYAED